MRLFKSKPRLGVVLLGCWLIATGILHLVPRISFSGSGEILAGLAIVAGCPARAGALAAQTT